MLLVHRLAGSMITKHCVFIDLELGLALLVVCSSLWGSATVAAAFKYQGVQVHRWPC
jgi:hypothetical protein